MDRRRLLIVLVTVGLVALAVAPAVLTFARGWLSLPSIRPAGEPAARATSSPEAWVLFAVFYLVWMVALAVVLVWAYDRLDYHWHYHERAPRSTKKRRRRVAAMRLFAAREARGGAAKRPGREPRRGPPSRPEPAPPGPPQRPEGASRSTPAPRRPAGGSGRSLGRP